MVAAASRVAKLRTLVPAVKSVTAILNGSNNESSVKEVDGSER